MAERADGTGIARIKAMKPRFYSGIMNRISKGASGEGNGTGGVVFGSRQSGGRVGARTLDNEQAFTLVELLAVIAIIALLAGIVLGTAGIATTKSHESRRKGEHARWLTAIE